MPQAHPDTVKLPRALLDKLSSCSPSCDKSAVRKPVQRLAKRKEQRKSARDAKQQLRSRTNRPSLARDVNYKGYRSAIDDNEVHSAKMINALPKPTRPTSKIIASRPVSENVDSSSQLVIPSQLTKARPNERNPHAEDDAEIAALERALGIKDKKKLPRGFEDDGLVSLLDGLNSDDASDEAPSSKRKRAESNAWLEGKRRKAQKNAYQTSVIKSNDGCKYKEFRDEDDPELSSHIRDEDVDSPGVAREYSQSEAFGGEGDGPGSATEKVKDRENPYRAPVVSAMTIPGGKYIPPSLRNRDVAGLEDLSQLRRQIQGLLNRLSDANLIRIVGDVEKLFHTHPRQHVSSLLVEFLLGLLCDPASLEDTFIILHAGFTAGLYKTIGPDFGAQVVHKIHEEIMEQYRAEIQPEETNKKLMNLMSFVAELYNFQVVGNNLIYDFVRFLLETPSEMNIELLLRVVRSTSQQLRQEDPSTLKDIIRHFQAKVAAVGMSTFTVRTRFLIESLNNLKNSRMKVGIAASTIVSEHTIRMKRTLGSLNQQSIRASEPLRIGLKDLRNAEKRGKWWLVGSSYKDEDQNIMDSGENEKALSRQTVERKASISNMNNDLGLLAKEQRMNTNIRRSIFIAIMSGDDYHDAYVRLMKLRLTKNQELEIPKVLIHCSGAEMTYNPYYTLLSRKICSDRRLRKAFQFALWVLLGQMGEGNDLDTDSVDGADELDFGLRSVVNIAKMFGTLIADGGLSLGVLKILELGYLQAKTRVFVEVVLITAMLQSQKKSARPRDEKSLASLFHLANETPEVKSGLLFFLSEVVAKSDLVGSSDDRATIQWGCKVAKKTLRKGVKQSQADE